MQGIFIGGRRSPTKKALKEAVATAPETVRLEATSIFGNEFDGRITDAPIGSYTVVGPDPYTSRKWYAQIKVGPDKVVVS